MEITINKRSRKQHISVTEENGAGSHSSEGFPTTLPEGTKRATSVNVQICRLTVLCLPGGGRKSLSRKARLEIPEGCAGRGARDEFEGLPSEGWMIRLETLNRAQINQF